MYYKLRFLRFTNRPHHDVTNK